MIAREFIAELLSEYLKEKKDIFLVEVKNTPDNKIKVFLDSKTSLSIEDCIDASRWLEAKMDRGAEDYELQVSSAGIGSPFKVKEQYEKAVGKQVQIALKDGRKVNGLLVSFQEGKLQIEEEKKVVVEGKKKKQIIQEIAEFLLDEINTAKEIITF